MKAVDDELQAERDAEDRLWELLADGIRAAQETRPILRVVEDGDGE